MNHLILYEVSKRFGGVRAVDEVSLEFAVRKTHAIIGPNGAGKTTLFNLISGSLPLSGGRIQLGDVQNFARLRPHQRALCGVVRTFQITSLFPALTVREHLALSSRSALGLNGRLTDRGHGAEIERRSHDILQQLRLGTIADRVVKELSHGEQRKVEIALGLALDPQFLLLDEPTAGMSKAESREMIVSLQNLRESQPEIGIVIVEHDMDVVFALADEVTVMHQGRVLVSGAPKEVRENPVVIEAYLGRESLTEGGTESNA